MGRRNAFAAAFKNDFACGPCGYSTGSTTAIEKHMSSLRHRRVMQEREEHEHSFVCDPGGGVAPGSRCRASWCQATWPLQVRVSMWAEFPGKGYAPVCAVHGLLRPDWGLPTLGDCKAVVRDHEKVCGNQDGGPVRYCRHEVHAHGCTICNPSAKKVNE